MKNRRAWITGLFAAIAGQGATQKWGSVNQPSCPVCHSQLQAGHPEWAPVVDDPAALVQTLPNLRDCFCGNCGARYVVSV